MTDWHFYHRRMMAEIPALWAVFPLAIMIALRQRPACTQYFAPKNANFKQIKKDLKRLEDNFFAGKEL